MAADPIRVALAGPGAIGERHLMAVREAGGQVSAVVSPIGAEAAVFADRYDIPIHAPALGQVLDRPEVDAVILASPSQVHNEQAMQSLAAGKPVLCEIPCGLSLGDAQKLAHMADSAGLPTMVAHTYRFAAPHRELRRRIESDRFAVRHFVSHHLNLRHENVGWTGRRRVWVDDVLWHHGGHEVDLALWFLDTTSVAVAGQVGPVWPGNGHHMDFAAVLVAPDGDLASIAMSYHSRVRAGTFTLIGEDETYAVRDGVLVCNGETVLDAGGFDGMMKAAMVLQAREFFAAITEQRRPICSIHDIVPTMEVLEELASRRLQPVGGGL